MEEMKIKITADAHDATKAIRHLTRAFEAFNAKMVEMNNEMERLSEQFEELQNLEINIEVKEVKKKKWWWQKYLKH
jgi:hypothetical protein